MAREPHPLIVQMHNIRRNSGLSVAQVGRRIGIGAVTVGSYERGDREPPLFRVTEIFDLLGYELRVVPKGTPGGDPVEAVIALADRLAAIAQSLRALGGGAQ